MAIVGAFMVPHPPLIVPSVGHGQQHQIENTVKAYHMVAEQIEDLYPDTIVVISPHAPMYRDYIHISGEPSARGDFGIFGVPEEKMDALYDADFVDLLCSKAEDGQINAGNEGATDHLLDHATMVPLYFVNQVYTNYQLVRIGICGLPYKTHFQLGEYIRQVSEELNRRTVIIASGDLSHHLKDDGPYGYTPEGPEYDQKIMEIMEKADFARLMELTPDFCEKAGECGHRSFVMMSGALKGLEVHPKKLSYEGPFGVGYGICAYEIHYAIKDPYIKLAKRALETFVKEGYMITEKSIEEDMVIKETASEETITQEEFRDILEKRAGAFVCIKKYGQLRGCIGTIQATEDNLVSEMIHNAISAGMYDPRFPPVNALELKDLVYSVDIMGETETIDSPEQLDVKKYGVIVTSGSKRGLLLPNLEGVDAIEEQIAIARNKAGIRAGEKIKLERFEVIRHE